MLSPFPDCSWLPLSLPRLHALFLLVSVVPLRWQREYLRYRIENSDAAAKPAAPRQTTSRMFLGIASSNHPRPKTSGKINSPGYHWGTIMGFALFGKSVLRVQKRAPRPIGSRPRVACESCDKGALGGGFGRNRVLYQRSSVLGVTGFHAGGMCRRYVLTDSCTRLQLIAVAPLSLMLQRSSTHNIALHTDARAAATMATRG